MPTSLAKRVKIVDPKPEVLTPDMTSAELDVLSSVTHEANLNVKADNKFKLAITSYNKAYINNTSETEVGITLGTLLAGYMSGKWKALATEE